MNLRLLHVAFFLVIVSEKTFSQSDVAAPVLVWEKKYGNNAFNESANDAVINPDGTILVIGRSRSDTGIITDHHGAAGTYDAWVIKLDTAGNLLWTKSFGGTGFDMFHTILPTLDNGYLCLGYTRSVDDDLSGNNNKVGSWVAKLSHSGNIEWSKAYGNLSQYNSIVMNESGTTFGGVVLEDGSYAVTLRDTFFNFSLAKLDALGNIVWQSPYNNKTGKFVIETSNHQLLTSSGLMFDPVTGDTSRFVWSPAGFVEAFKKVNDRIYVAVKEGKVNKVGYIDESNGNFISETWRTDYTPIGDFVSANYHNLTGNGLAVLPGNSVLVAGTYLTIPNSCPSCFYKDPISYSGGYIRYHFDVGTNNSEGYMSVDVLPNNSEFLFTGHYSGKFYIRKFAIRNIIKGKLFFDLNNNNVQDAGEPPCYNLYVRSSKPGEGSTTKSFGGNFTNFADTGSYTTSVVLDQTPYYSATPASKASTFTDYRQSDSVNFAIHKLFDYRDFSISLASFSPTRPFFPVSYKIAYSNKGTDMNANKTIWFLKDHHLDLVQTNPAFSRISGDTIFWNINNINAGTEGAITINAKVGTTYPVAIRDILHCYAFIDSTGDNRTVDNIDSLKQIVTGSFDPNDKSEIHGNSIAKVEIQNGNYLTYTIRFQNTGTDTAFTINVRDTLDDKLDWTTLEMVNASHPYFLKIKNGKFATWEFDNILLVDSFRNERESHGFITYRIKAKNNLVVGDIINNSASIYFDFNSPVLTNTQKTIVVAIAKWTGAVSTAWENPANWSTNAIPDAETIVTVPSGVPHFPLINSNASCFTLNVDKNVTVSVNTGFNLNITGK